jgi:hypothetical protein
VDIKKLGNLPHGGGHKAVGRPQGRKNRSGAGYAYLHNAVDDHSRLAYSETPPDEKKEIATAFWDRAHAYFASAALPPPVSPTSQVSTPRANRAGPEGHHRSRPYQHDSCGETSCHTPGRPGTFPPATRSPQES